MNDLQLDLNKSYYQWLAELNRLQGPRIIEDKYEGLTVDSLVNYLRGITK